MRRKKEKNKRKILEGFLEINAQQSEPNMPDTQNRAIDKK